MEDYLERLDEIVETLGTSNQNIADLLIDMQDERRANREDIEAIEKLAQQISKALARAVTIADDWED